MKKQLSIGLALIAAVACGDAKKDPVAKDGDKKPAPVATTAPAATTTPTVIVDSGKLAMFKALPEHAFLDGKVAEKTLTDLGRQLYYDKRLSKNHDISCNSCHQLDKFGVDGQPFSPGHKGQLGGRNSPTVYNAALHIAQFWDGRAADVEAQAKGPVLNPVEMAMADEASVVKVLKSIPGYVETFDKAFPADKDAVNYDNMAKAIGAFERRLLTPGRWDKFLSGDKSALTNEEKAGLLKFVEVGCTACHNGVGMGGNMYQKLGLVKAWPNLKDEGRSAVTGNAAEKFYFKVPSLRNIAHTAPYMHDGSVKTLDDAIAKMAEFQLGKQLKPEEVKSIASFLKALTGEAPADYIKQPTLPESGPSTPKADPN